MNFNQVLVICAGNICRSPMAEVLVKQRYPQLKVWSAGLTAMVDHPADEKSQICVARDGLDLSQHKAKQLTKDDVSQADLILTMSTRQQKDLERTYPFAKGKVFRLGHWQNKDISDPHHKPQEAFDEAYQLMLNFLPDWDKFLKG